MSIVLRKEVRGATRSDSLLVGEDFVGHAEFNVGGLACEKQHRLVLRLPAEFGDGAVVSVAIETSPDAALHLGPSQAR